MKNKKKHTKKGEIFMKKITRRSFLQVAGAGLAAMGLAACSGSSDTTGSSTGDNTSWPTNTVTIEIAAAAGGGTDTIGRIFTNSWQKSTGEAFTVVDDATGNGTVAYEAVRNAKPDGYTLLFYHSTMPIQYYQGVYDKNPADPANFTVIANLANGGDADVLCVPANAPYDSMAEFIEYCKAHPGEVVFGNQNGGFGQLECLLLGSRAGIDVRFVDAGGQADTIISLLGGNIDACFIGSDAAMQYQASGDMKCLAICSEKRSAKNVPDVPTMQECGVDVVFNTVFVVLGPSNMDADLVETINKALGQAAEDSDVAESLGNMGNSYTYKTVAESKQIWEEHCATVKEVCTLAGYDVSNK
jgi:tripartite-type tricarboxylate transporter receptor subunit TctC